MISECLKSRTLPGVVPMTDTFSYGLLGVWELTMGWAPLATASSIILPIYLVSSEITEVHFVVNLYQLNV